MTTVVSHQFVVVGWLTSSMRFPSNRQSGTTILVLYLSHTKKDDNKIAITAQLIPHDKSVHFRRLQASMRSWHQRSSSFSLQCWAL